VSLWKHQHWQIRVGVLSKHSMGTRGDPGGTALVVARSTREICSYIGAVRFARFVSRIPVIYFDLLDANTPRSRWT